MLHHLHMMNTHKLRSMKKVKAGDSSMSSDSVANVLTPLSRLTCFSLFFPQPWPSISNLAKDFIQRLLLLDPSTRLTADQAVQHPWVVTMAASSSTRNLRRSISQNLRQRMSRSSMRCRSTSSGDRSSVGPNGLMSPAAGVSGVPSAKM